MTVTTHGRKPYIGLETATVTAGNTTVTRTHKLGAVPTDVFLSPQDDLGGRSFWCPTATRTVSQVVVHISAVDMANDHVFDVMVVVE